MWPDALRTGDWYVNIPSTTLAFVVLALIALRFNRQERHHVGRVSALFLSSILAAFVAGILDATGYARPAVYAHEVAVVASGVAIILVAAIVVFRILLPRFHLMPPRILQDVLVAISLIVFGLVRLGLKGIDTASLFTTSALITAVVALSLQDTLGNILGGLALQLDRSVQVGDWVKLDTLAGQVVEIGWRQTSIETNDWETIVVPNSVLVKNRFLVLGRRTHQPLQQRRWIPFYVDAQHPPDRVIHEVQSSLRSMDIPSVAKEPAPQCFLIELAENPARYAVSYWLTNLAQMNPTDSSIRVQAYLALKRSGIPIAVPARNVLLTEDTSERRAMRKEQELSQRLMALRTVDLFRGFSPDELQRLAEHLQPAPYIAGDVLVRQGATGHRLYIIVEGRADVLIDNSGGERAKVAELGPGDFFGEMSLMTGETRSATVVATTNTLVYRLDKDSFRDLLASRTDVAEQISSLLASRRAELDAVREGLDSDAMAARAASTRRDIRQKIWQLFGLED